MAEKIKGNNSDISIYQIMWSIYLGNKELLLMKILISLEKILISMSLKHLRLKISLTNLLKTQF